MHLVLAMGIFDILCDKESYLKKHKVTTSFSPKWEDCDVIFVNIYSFFERGTTKTVVFHISYSTKSTDDDDGDDNDDDDEVDIAPRLFLLIDMFTAGEEVYNQLIWIN